MRKIERKMLSALRDRRDWSLDNTTVYWGIDADSGEPEAHVRLHGNLIAMYRPEEGALYVTDAGWQTVTTKSRLNALLSGLETGRSIFQKDWVWYVTSHRVDDQPAVPFHGGWYMTRPAGA